MADGTHGPIRYPFETPPEPGLAKEVAEGVLWIRMPLPMALDHVNVYALDDGDGWTIVDSGLNSGRSRGHWEALLSGVLAGKPVRRILVTHHHPDHVGLAGWFQEVHGAELLMTRTAWLFARMLSLDVQEDPVPATLLHYRRAGMDPAVYQERATERPFNFADVLWPMPLGFTRLAEGDVIAAGGRSWDVRIGHGHAPDHATLWSREDGLVIGGDQLLPSISPNLGAYATEPGADPVAEWLEACERLAVFARADQLVLGGHKLPFTGLPARMVQKIQNHHGALDRLRAHLAEPHSACGCFPVLFKRRIGSGEYGLAMVEAIAHVNHLYALGETERMEGPDGAWLYKMK